jgi:hypothetical protein
MSATRTTASAILKNVYQGVIVDQINNPNVLLKFIERNSRDIVEGSKIVGSIRLRPSQGIGARAELGTLPTAGNTSFGAPQDNLKHMYGVMKLSGPLVRAAESQAAAFARAMKAEADGMTVGLRLDQQRVVYGSESNDGRIAVCGVTTASATCQLATGSNMRYFEVGMLVDVVIAATGVAIANGTAVGISAIDEVNFTLTLDGGVVTTDATHIVVRAGNYGNEMNGLEAIISSTYALHGVNPATAGNERWKGNVNAAFGAFSSSKFQSEVDNAHNRSGEWITHILSQECRLFAASLRRVTRLSWMVASLAWSIRVVVSLRSGSRTPWPPRLPLCTASGSLSLSSSSMVSGTSSRSMVRSGSLISSVPLASMP